MKNLLLFFLLVISSVVSGQTIKITEADLQRALNLNKGNLMFNNSVFSTNDTIINKEAGAVYSRLSKFNRAVLFLKKIDTKYVGRFWKNDVVYYELTKTDTGYVFLSKNPNDLESNGLIAEGIDPRTVSIQTLKEEAKIAEEESRSDLYKVQALNYACMFYDFDGHTVEGTGWNYNGPIVCAPVSFANSTDTCNYIINRLKQLFYPFNIVVTRDSAVYFAAAINKRMRVINTPTYQWYGSGSAGVGFVGSFTWGDDTPCFAFYGSGSNTNFQYNVDILAHEAGTVLALYHQSSYNSSCVKTNEYNRGYGTGETSFCPVMGANTSFRNMLIWWNGPNPYGCNSLQNDMAIIVANNGFGYKSNLEYPTDFKSARSLSAGAPLNQSVINTSDSDYFKINVYTTGTTTLNAAPLSFGANNYKALVKLKMRLYNEKGVLVAESNNPTTLNATISQSITPGIYYVVVRKEGVTDNPTAYGFYGYYSLTQN